MRDYRDIASIEELDAAIADNRKAIRRKEARLSRRYEKVQNFYTPSTFVSEGARRVVQSLPVTEMALYMLGRLRRRLEK